MYKKHMHLIMPIVDSNSQVLDHVSNCVYLLDIPCAGGSDAPVEPAQPFLGIYDAIFRPSGDRDPDKLKPFRYARTDLTCQPLSLRKTKFYILHITLAYAAKI